MTHRRQALAALACLGMAWHCSALPQAQPQPGAPNPPPPSLGNPPPPPQPLPGDPGGGYPNPGFPGAPPNPALQRPHQGNLPNAPASPASKRFAGLPAVTIREFRSSVAEVPPRGATDMFIGALVKTRKFRVLERARMAEGVAAEKNLNQQGMTTGQAGQSQYEGATYYFEGTLSEASTGDARSSFSVGVAGAAAGQARSSDSIAIDVRMVDVESGVVVDAVSVRKTLQSVETRAGGATSALVNIFTRGRGSAAADVLAPNDQYVKARRDSLDKALREAIDEAVRDIARRFVSD